MVLVKKKQGESDDKLIARFKKKVLYSGILLEMREKDRYKKKSEERKEKKYRLKFLNKLEKKRNA